MRPIHIIQGSLGNKDVADFIGRVNSLEQPPPIAAISRPALLVEFFEHELQQPRVCTH
jgi:hypothetical protein